MDPDVASLSLILGTIDRVNKATFVGEGFTRKPVKMERFIRPMALRYKKANVTHRMSCPSLIVMWAKYDTAELKATFQLQIIGVKKNPQSPMFTQLGVMTRGTIIEVNVRCMLAIYRVIKLRWFIDFRTRSSHYGRKSRLGQVCASHKQPGIGCEYCCFSLYLVSDRLCNIQGCINAVLLVWSWLLVFGFSHLSCCICNCIIPIPHPI